MAMTGTCCACNDLISVMSLRRLAGFSKPVVVVAEDGLRIRFVGVFEGLGDEVGTDDLQPERVSQDVCAAVG